MSNEKLPAWFIYLAHISPWFICIFFLTVSLVSPEKMDQFVAQDYIGGGLVENLTVAVLIPGILLGLYTFIKYRKSFQPHWAAYWLLAWSFACIYFAGEEASWGQWYFEWATPESFSEINDQNETNLHNISTWLDQKPRTLVELWIFFTGLIWPLVNIVKHKKHTDWRYWIHPVSSLVSAAAVFTIVKLANFISAPNPLYRFGSSEFRELCIAVFLTLFLISFYARRKQLAP